MISVVNIKDQQSGSTAAEFAMVLPLVLLFIFGLIDAGRYIWTYNKAEKAVQMGVRFAVSTDLIPKKLATYSFVVDGKMFQGAPITADKFSGVRCFYSGSVQCESVDQWVDASTPSSINSTAFDNIYAEMKKFLPDSTFTEDKLEVRYDWAGLGYAGNPNGPDIAPLITVSVKGMQFTPITSLLFAQITMRDVTSALTMEDGSGTAAN